MTRRRFRLRDMLLGAAAAGTVGRNLRTVLLSRRVLGLREPSQAPVVAPLVTVIVPARNEGAGLDACVRAIRAQHGGSIRQSPHLRIVVVDDDSTDETGPIAERHAAADSRVSVVRGNGPPPEWAGKVHALHAGVQAAGNPEPGEWMLFLDADTVLAEDALTRLIASAEDAEADLVSTPGGPPLDRSVSWPLLMPQGLQMIAENASPDGRGSKAFAIGHCILMRRTHYEKMGGWAALHSRRNEDVAIATAVRDHGGTTRVVDGLDHVVTTGMDPFSQGWGSFRKSFVAGTNASVPVLIGAGLGQITLSLAAPTAVVSAVRNRRRGLAAVGLAGWFAQGLAHRSTAKLMRANPEMAPFAPLTGTLFGFLLLDGARQVLRGRISWKGRAG